MKRVLFIYSRVEDRIEASGEANKMKMQMSALDEYGIHSDIIYHNRNVNANKILIRLPIYSIYGKPFIQKVCKVVDQYDAIYIRKYVFDGYTYRKSTTNGGMLQIYWIKFYTCCVKNSKEPWKSEKKFLSLWVNLQTKYNSKTHLTNTLT